MSEVLTDLRQGATVCLGNARRLLDEAEVLFRNKGYLSCFLLSELATEEIAKGYRLLEKVRKKEEFSRKEWEDWTKKPRAHIKKLKYVHQIDDAWLRKVLDFHGISYQEFSKGFLKNFPGAKNIEDYWEKTSQAYYDFRLDILYVNYDFKKNQWIDPLSYEPAQDPNFSLQGLVRAKHLLSIFEAALKRK